MLGSNQRPKDYESSIRGVVSKYSNHKSLKNNTSTSFCWVKNLLTFAHAAPRGARLDVFPEAGQENRPDASNRETQVEVADLERQGVILMTTSPIIVIELGPCAQLWVFPSVLGMRASDDTTAPRICLSVCEGKE